jgi:hypothetical protein
MGTDNGVEFLGHRENEVKIGNRQELSLSFLDPGLGIPPVAFGAVAVSTGVVGIP